MAKNATPMLEQLAKTLEEDKEQREELIKKIKGIVVFIIDGEKWTLDLRPGKGSLNKGGPEDKADISLTMTDATFVSLVMGKIGSQQAFLMRKLKINGSMGLAMKLQPILDAAAPKSKIEIDDSNIIKLQRFDDLTKRGLRSHDLGLPADALESANWNPLKKLSADKHSRKQHGITRDEVDDMLDIICGSDDVMDIKYQLENLVKYGRFVAFVKNTRMVHNVEACIQYRIYSLSVEQLLKMSKFTYAMLPFDGHYQYIFSSCVREVLRRCSFSYKKFVRHAGGEDAAAKDLASMTGILAFACKKFHDDFVVANSYKKSALIKGPWKDNLKTWIHRQCLGLYCRHNGYNVLPEGQLHVTQLPEIILKIAEFLGRHGGNAVSTLDKSTIVSMAANLYAAFDEIKKTKCDWLVVELAVRLFELARQVADAGLGYECPEGTVLESLKIIADSG